MSLFRRFGRVVAGFLLGMVLMMSQEGPPPLPPPPPLYEKRAAELIAPPPLQEMKAAELIAPPLLQEKEAAELIAPPPLQEKRAAELIAPPPLQEKRAAKPIEPSPLQKVAELIAPPPLQEKKAAELIAPPFQENKAAEPIENTPPYPKNLKEGSVYDHIWAPKHFLIEEGDFCLRHPDLKIISIVHSSITWIEKRQVTRDTWASLDVYSKYGIKMAVVFLVGRAKNKVEEIIVKEESEKFHDVVQGDFEDSYELLSFKALAAMVWISRHCTHVPWTLHADDDVLIDDFLLLQKIQAIENNKEPEMFHCFLFPRSHVMRAGKWKVAETMFSEAFYPPYCDGPMWFIQTSAVPRLLAASRTTRFLWVEDAYLTGLVAKEANITHTSSSFNHNIAYDRISESDLGQKFSWNRPPGDRRLWWKKIVLYHAKWILKQGEDSKASNA